MTLTIKAQVLLALADSKEPLTAPQILQRIESKVELATVAQTLSTLKGDGLADHAGKTTPESGHALILWALTDLGREFLKDDAGGVQATEQTPRGGVTRKPKAKGKRKAAKKEGKKRGAGVHKVQRRNAVSRRGRGGKAAKKAWKTRRANDRSVSATVSKSHSSVSEQHSAAAPLWSLRSDGAFTYGATLELPADAARPLVDLVRRTSPPQLEALIAFIRTLDKAEA